MDSTKRKKALSMTAITERAIGTAACSRAAISHLDFNTAVVDRQATIADLLCKGQQNAVPLRDLCSLTGLDGRTVRNRISAERMRGVPILSDNANGYFLPSNTEEKARFVRSMRHRAQEILRAADAVEKA